MKFLQLSSKDFLKGLILSILTVIVAGLYAALSATPPHFPTSGEWVTLAMSGLTAGVAYLMKNLFTNSKDQFLKTEPK